MNITKRQAAIARRILEDERHPSVVISILGNGYSLVADSLRQLGWLSVTDKECYFDYDSVGLDANQLRTALAFIVTLGEDK